MENSVKTSDEILNELFESIKPNEDSEASEGSASLSEGEDKETPKKAKKSKKDKKSKKKKKEKKKKRSPERKSRPLSPVQDRSRRDHKSGIFWSRHHIFNILTWKTSLFTFSILLLFFTQNFVENEHVRRI